MTRREAMMLLASAGCRAESRRPAPAALEKGVRYLWSLQAPDGGWHSTTYGLLRSGQSLTPLVLEALLRASVPPAQTERMQRAVTFIEKQVRADGAVGLMNPLAVDYPNYATALAVLALRRAGRADRIAPLVRYLRQQQLTEQNGWTRDHPAYGAWGMEVIGALRPTRGT